MIGERIKQLREDFMEPQSYVAEAINISQSALGNYERGTRLPDATVIIALAKYFNVSTDYLLGLTNDPAPFPSAVDELGISKEAANELSRLKELGLSDYFCAMLCAHTDSFEGLLNILRKYEGMIAHQFQFSYPDLMFTPPEDRDNMFFHHAVANIEDEAREKLGVYDLRLVVENDYIDYLKFKAHSWLDQLLSFIANTSQKSTSE